MHCTLYCTVQCLGVVGVAKWGAGCLMATSNLCSCHTYTGSHQTTLSLGWHECFYWKQWRTYTMSMFMCITHTHTWYTYNTLSPFHWDDILLKYSAFLGFRRFAGHVGSLWFYGRIVLPMFEVCDGSSGWSRDWSFLVLQISPQSSFHSIGSPVKSPLVSSPTSHATHTGQHIYVWDLS